MYKDVQKFVKSCGVCQIARGVSQNTRLYTPIFVPEKHWSDISMDFFLVFHICVHSACLCRVVVIAEH